MAGRRSSLALTALLAVALSLAGTHCCLASTYIVNPVSMTLTPSEPQGLFRLVNEDSHPVRIEIAVKVWSQEDHQNVERDTTDLIVSPLITVIPPRSAQVVRIGVRSLGEISAERSYRLLFQDLGDPTETAAAPGTTRVDYSVPVFFASDAPGGPKLEYTIKKTEASSLTLSITNHGDVHEKIIVAALERGAADSTPDDEVLDPIDANTRRYVLAGATLDLKLHLSARVAQGESLVLDVLIAGKHLRIPLTVQ